MRTEIRELHQRLGTTTVYATHNQIEAMTMADKIVVMQAGYIEQVGSPLELYDTPANIFVAGFIGSPSMNFFDGVVGDAGNAVDIGGLMFEVGARDGLSAGQRVVFGIRPGHLHLGKGGFAVTMAVVAVFRERHTFAAGQQISHYPEAAHVVLFDADSRTRIG